MGSSLFSRFKEIILGSDIWFRNPNQIKRGNRNNTGNWCWDSTEKCLISPLILFRQIKASGDIEHFVSCEIRHFLVQCPHSTRKCLISPLTKCFFLSQYTKSHLRYEINTVSISGHMILIWYRFGFDPGYSSCDWTICLVSFWVGVNSRRTLFCLIRNHGILTITDTILDPISVPSRHKNRWNNIKSVSNRNKTSGLPVFRIH